MESCRLSQTVSIQTKTTFGEIKMSLKCFLDIKQTSGIEIISKQ